MSDNCTYISYEQTTAFKQIVIDYIHQKKELQPFYNHPVSLEGIEASIAERKNFNTNRQLLVDVLRNQYSHIQLTEQQEFNLNALLSNDTFTITTAHQPNIFTGPLYFIYKIIHAIKMADELKKSFNNYHFVPFYYMGSEDADLDELGYIYINGEKKVWNTQQTGAVGRMLVDNQFIQLILEIQSQIDVLPFGKELSTLFKESYTIGTTIQDATLLLVNKLFAHFGLLILIPDNAALKMAFEPVIEKELIEQFSHKAVAETIQELSKNYKVQASGRNINLFYLLNDKRERIEKNDTVFFVSNLDLQWTESEILLELKNHPERFSANVILRGVFQETVLPNIAFIGGGGEIAYWLELKKVFEAAKVPYPMLVLRNSFLLVNEKERKQINNMQFSVVDFFASTNQVLEKLIQRNSTHQLELTQEIEQLQTVFNKIKSVTDVVDSTLTQHTNALQTKFLKSIYELEKKILRAEKRKYSYQQQQINHIKQTLFPNNNLQERIVNIAAFYPVLGVKLLQIIYDASKTLEQEFCIIDIQ